jgi:hypothetical protein
MKMLGTKARRRLLKGIFGGLAALSASAFGGNAVPFANAGLVSPALKTSVPLDYSAPYRVVGGSAYAVSATAPTTISQLVSGEVQAATVVNDGEFRKGSVKNIRPSLYVYYQNGQWWQQSLRVPKRGQPAASPVAFGQEPQPVCNDWGIGVFSDWAHSENSIISYFTAGPDFQCDSGDEEQHVMSVRATTTTPAITTQMIRAFYATDGSISGILGFAGASLLKYEPTLTYGPKVLISNLLYARNAGTYARTATTAYVRVKDLSGLYGIYSVNSDDTIAGPFISGTNSIGPGYADADALYFQTYSTAFGTQEVVRVPFASMQSPVVLYTGALDGQFFGVSDHAVIVSRSGGSEIVAIEKNTGSSVTTLASMTATVSDSIFSLVYSRSHVGFAVGDYADVFVSGNTIYWTAYDDYDSQYWPTSSRAGISLDDGTVVESHANAAWIGRVSSTVQYNTPGDTSLNGVVLLSGYTGPLDVTGFQGGAVTYYDLTQGVQSPIGTVTAAGVFPISSFYAVTTLPFQYMPETGRTDLDMYVFDTASPLMTQLTDTPTIDEIAP